MFNSHDPFDPVKVTIKIVLILLALRVLAMIVGMKGPVPIVDDFLIFAGRVIIWIKNQTMHLLQIIVG